MGIMPLNIQQKIMRINTTFATGWNTGNTTPKSHGDSSSFRQKIHDLPIYILDSDPTGLLKYDALFCPNGPPV